MSALSLRQRSAIADATLAAGATILLLYSTTTERALVSLATGIALVVLGMALLWGTPRPKLSTRLAASMAGLLVAFGIASWSAGWAAWAATAAGIVLLGAVLRATR